MPIQRRLPKFGFTSRMARHYAEVRLHEIASIEGGNVNVETLIAAGLVPLQTKTVKIIRSGEIGSAVKVSGCRVTKGARSAIEAAGGSVSDAVADSEAGAVASDSKANGPADAGGTAKSDESVSASTEDGGDGAASGESGASASRDDDTPA